MSTVKEFFTRRVDLKVDTINNLASVPGASAKVAAILGITLQHSPSEIMAAKCLVINAGNLNIEAFNGAMNSVQGLTPIQLTIAIKGMTPDAQMGHLTPTPEFISAIAPHWQRLYAEYQRMQPLVFTEDIKQQFLTIGRTSEQQTEHFVKMIISQKAPVSLYSTFHDMIVNCGLVPQLNLA